MDMVQLARCAFNHHHRDSRRVRFEAGHYRSTCTGCGKKMVKVSTSWLLSVDHALVGAD